jgi:hypothetical protein
MLARIAIMAMTTNSSIKVKPDLDNFVFIGVMGSMLILFAPKTSVNPYELQFRHWGERYGGCDADLR